jgi:quercetin dioxygenase-like cupin family protein
MQQATTRDRRIFMPVPSASLEPYVRQASEHQRLAHTGGAEFAVILDAAITGGQLTVIESHSRGGSASPVHVHSRDDEAFLLLDGQMTVWVGEERHRLLPGGIAFLPRGIPHAVRCGIASRALACTHPARGCRPARGLSGGRAPGWCRADQKPAW